MCSLETTAYALYDGLNPIYLGGLLPELLFIHFLCIVT